jgi:hypothetical protein
MNRKRGRPRGKVFPQPDNVFKGLWIAGHGQIGASAAMQIVDLCPYQEIRRIEKLPVEKRSVRDKRALELYRRYFKKWNPEIGRIVGEKIAAGDYTFFRELATAIESLTNKKHPYSLERLLALEHKLGGDIWGQPFTLRGLRAYYRRRGIKKIDSSKLSKLYRWAKSAEWRKLPAIPPGMLVKNERRENAILKT